MLHQFATNLQGLTVLKDKEEIFENYLIYGHPTLLIPGFVATYGDPENELPNDIIGTADDVNNIMLDWPGIALGWGEYVDQNGGEFDSEYLVADDGLVTIGYSLWGVEYPNKEPMDELTFKLTGYVIQHPTEDYCIFVVKSLLLEGV